MKNLLEEMILNKVEVMGNDICTIDSVDLDTHTELTETVWGVVGLVAEKYYRSDCDYPVSLGIYNGKATLELDDGFGSGVASVDITEDLKKYYKIM